MQTVSCAWCSRRRFLGGLAFGSAALFAPGVFAEELLKTPAQTEGPFYPDKLPLDTDNDLIVINDALTPAVGEITYVSGKILDARGNPVKNAVVEIWQCDNNGAYLHSGTSNAGQEGQEFPGLRPLRHRLDRRIPVPHDQAGALSGPHAAHPFQGQAEGEGAS